MMDGAPKKTNPISTFEAQVTDRRTNQNIQLETVDAQMIDGKPNNTNPINMFEARTMDRNTIQKNPTDNG